MCIWFQKINVKQNAITVYAYLNFHLVMPINVVSIFCVLDLKIKVWAEWSLLPLNLRLESPRGTTRGVQCTSSHYFEWHSPKFDLVLDGTDLWLFNVFCCTSGFI